MLSQNCLSFSLLIILYGTAAYPHDNGGVSKKQPTQFKVYWQVPTELCHKHKIEFSKVAKIGIVQNTGDRFKGDKIVILYDPGKFPFLNGSDYVNGGLPQFGDLNHHERILREDITKYIPNKNFDGIAVIDFEYWRPVFRENWASLDVYRTMSKDFVRDEHPDWEEHEIFKEAERRWEAITFPFFKRTLKIAFEERPKAKWGFYGFPQCFNFAPTNERKECNNRVKDDNDKSKWMYQEGKALYPSVYFDKIGMTETMRAELIEYRVKEGVRIAKKSATKLPVYAYTWFKYRDSGHELISKTDMLNNLLVPKKHGANGVIIWGSSEDVNTKEKCEQLHKFFENCIVPAMKRVAATN
uniref:Hyaluronidase n=1 Tax=Lethocerus distinctifemur TaxID=280095 RepID=A0A2K8JLN6_9HEMI|nr:venom hyaluronidase [Lethocerus distinctifemur]